MAKLLELEEHPIRINTRGEWWHGDGRLHPRVETLFRRHIALDDDGAYIIQLQFRRSPLQVEDTAFFVDSLRLALAGARVTGAQILVSDGAWEPLDPQTLMQSETNVLYGRVSRQGFAMPCRFRSREYHELALHFELDEATGQAFLPLGDVRYAVRPYDPRPLRLAPTPPAGATLANPL